MRRVADRQLWIGNPSDTRDVRMLLDAGIAAVVELADNEPLAELPRDLVRGRFPLSDGGDNPIWLLRLASESVAALLRVNVPVLVCCSGGMNRSVCVAAAGIALVKGRPLTEALLEVIGTGPADVSPRLFAQFQEALSE